MAERDQEKKLEELLDSMLAAYSSVEPRPGLETRVLANLRAARAEKPQPWWSVRWIWAGAAAIPAITLIFFLRPAQRPQSPETEVVRETQRPSQEMVNPRQVESASVWAARPRPMPKAPMRQVADLRPDVFPTPAPLSEQERLMLRYLAGTPREEIIAQSHVDEPPQDTLPENQTAVPGQPFSNSQLSNTR
jgi:hypothetical protein